MLGTTSYADRWLWRRGILDPTSRMRVNLPVFTGIVGFHLLALLACVPWLFSWSGLAWAVGGLYLFGTLGINIGYHRLLTHRGFECPRWLEHGLSVLGVCCWQGTPMNWVAIHRMHHQHSDEEGDPHSPRASFFWSHMGWFLIYDPAIYNISTYDRYARDLLLDRFYKWLERPQVWRMIHRVQWAVFLVGGMLVGAAWTWSPLGALRLGLSWLVWGVLLRTVAVWHITWSVNSITHIWGYRNFNTGDDSRNNWLVGLVSNGEGWHNNHHADPRSAAHGYRWWEFDVSYLTIRALSLVGLASNVARMRKLRVLERVDEVRRAA
jgi:stearoyl-CoA desaturase (delta-9 desaturase)